MEPFALVGGTIASRSPLALAADLDAGTTSRAHDAAGECPTPHRGGLSAATSGDRAAGQGGGLTGLAIEQGGAREPVAGLCGRACLGAGRSRSGGCAIVAAGFGC